MYGPDMKDWKTIALELIGGGLADCDPIADGLETLENELAILESAVLSPAFGDLADEIKERHFLKLRTRVNAIRGVYKHSVELGLNPANDAPPPKSEPVRRQRGDVA